MMNDSPSRIRGGAHLNRADPTRLGDGNLRHRAPPNVLMMRSHGVRRSFDNDVGLTEFFGGLPLVARRPLFGWRHVLGIAGRSACINPPDNGRDLLLAERHVVLEFLYTNIGIDMPWRHLSSDHALPDRLSPRTRFLIRQKRHRSHRTGAMTILALLLQYRRDVFGKSHRLV